MNEPLPESGIVRAVALDADAMPRGRLSLDVIREISELIHDRRLEAEIWIPEPVLWEWAEHACADLTVHAEKHATLRESLAGAGLVARLPEIPGDALDVDSIVDDVEQRLASFDRVRILHLHDDLTCAYGGLRDQILQVGAGRTKSKSVKTGASDGTSFRLIESAAGARLRDVVLVSGDDDTRRYFADRDAPALFRSWALLRAELINLRPRGEVESDDFASLARELLVSGSAPPGPQSIEAHNDAARAFLTSDLYLETTFSFGAIRSVGHIDEIELSDDGRFAAASVHATVDVELTGVYWNDTDDVLENDFEVLYNVPAQLNMEARMQDGMWSFTVVDGSISDDEAV